MMIIDRFEGNMAVLERGDVMFSVPRDLLPSDAREGDVVNLSLTLDRIATAERKGRIKALEDKLFRA